MHGFFAVFLMFVAFPTWAQLTAEQYRAKEQGVVFYQMKKSSLAAPFLTVAANAGDTDAQYYMGEIERRKVMYMTAAAQRWYERAAEKGDVYAMLRLATGDRMLCYLMENCALEIKSPSEWAAKARALAQEQAKSGDGEAMFQLYLLNGDFDWLIKSAKTGFPEGLDWLGVKYREGKGFFLTTNRRKKEVLRLFRAAAEAGYVPAMTNLFEFLPLEGNEREVGYWVEKAAQAGHYGAMFSYAAWTAHSPNQVGYPLDLVKAYGLTLLIAQAEPGTWRKSYGEEALVEIAEKMTHEQIEAGKLFAQEWKKNHPPLSKFLPKYGY